MCVDSFRSVDEFKAHLDNWIERFKAANPIYPDRKEIIPGETALKVEMDRKVNGIPLVDAVAKDLNELTEKMGVEK